MSTRNLFLLFLPIILQSCNPSDEIDCEGVLYHSYDKGNCPTCTILTDDAVYFDFRSDDSTYFPYSGTDTLLFEIRDSVGHKDTVEFIGQGKNYTTTYQNRVGLPDEYCLEVAKAKRLDINFKPNKIGYSDLLFTLIGDYYSTDFRYTYTDRRFEGTIYGLSRPFLPVFTFQGEYFYGVEEYTTIYLGRIFKFYVSKDDQLILILKDDSSHIFKISE